MFLVRPLVVVLFTMLVFSYASQVDAQTPASTPTAPTPVVAADPSTFIGAVTLDGSAAADGTVIEAVVNGIVCGSAVATQGRYDVTVKTSIGQGSGFQAGCGRNGDPVTFRSKGLVAAARATFVGGAAQTLDLVFGQPAATRDAPPKTPSAELSPTTKLPSTGTGSGSFPGPWVLMLSALLGVTGVAMTVRGWRKCRS